MSAKTKIEVCNEALRIIQVLAVHENAEYDDFERASSHLDAIIVELGDSEELAISWGADDVPLGAFLGVSNMLGGSLAIGYGRPDLAPLYEQGKKMVRKFEAAKVIAGQDINAVYY